MKNAVLKFIVIAITLLIGCAAATSAGQLSSDLYKTTTGGSTFLKITP